MIKYIALYKKPADPEGFDQRYFESAESMKAAFKTPEWASSGANLAEIGGMELVAMFSAEVVA